MLGIQAQGHEITTVEGLAPDEEHLSVLQEAFWEGMVCNVAYCTSGILTTMSIFYGKILHRHAQKFARRYRVISAGVPGIRIL